MESLIKDLIEKLSENKRKELDFIEQYKKNDVKSPILIATGKIIELDDLIKELEDMLQYNSRME
jgi:aspartyl/asparaginyl-tRNA synthetase